MPHELDRSLVTGIAWTAVFRWSAQIVSWGATFYAAHILTPAAYGIVAMAMVPIGLVRLIEDFGFDAVIVQDRMLTGEQMARLGGLALAIGAGLTVTLIVAAPTVADLFGEPAVAAVLAALSVLILLDAVQIVPRALLQRELRFRALAAIHGAQVVITSATLVALANWGAGHWALVFNTLAGAGAATILLLWCRPFMPDWPRRLASLRASILSGWRMLVARAAWYAYTNADSALVGRVLGKDALGHYSFALTLANTPIQEITTLVSRVIPGVFSAAQTDRALLRRYFLLVTEALSYLAFPVSVGIALTAEHIVPVALGPQWTEVVAPLRILCIYYALNAAQVLVAHVLLWTGHFRANMWFSLLACTGLPLAFLVGLRWGLVGVAWAWVIAFPLVCLPAMIFAWRILGMRWAQYFGALAPATSACAVMTVVVLWVRHALADGGSRPLASLAVEAAAGAVVYFAVLGLAHRSRIAALLDVIRGGGPRGGTAAPASPG